MKQIEDLAHDAFRAARAGWTERMRAELAEVILGTPAQLDTAVQLWMDRLIVILGDPYDENGQLHLRVEMLPDDSGTGRAESVAEVREELSWVGRMFVAYTLRRADLWQQLWAQVPVGQLFAYVERLLTTMAKTTLAYEEAHTADPAAGGNDTIHEWIRSNPAATGDRLAVAHRN